MRKTSIYVAGGSSEALLVATMIDKLEAEGFECTYNWTDEVLNPKQSLEQLSRIQRLNIASTDYSAVRKSDLVWVILPEVNSIGASAEMGAAIVLGVPLIVSGPHHRSAMTAPANWMFTGHEEAFDFICNYLDDFNVVRSRFFPRSAKV